MLLLVMSSLTTAFIPFAAATEFPLLIDYFSWDERTAAAVVVVEGDSVVYSEGFGFADREAGTAITSDTVFPTIESMPIILGLSALCLDARGILDVDAPLSTVLPDLTLSDPPTPNEITVLDLLTHDHSLRDGVATTRLRTCDFTPEM
jgi:CubicO group peptidase (beta-lactamase class C family)